MSIDSPMVDGDQASALAYIFLLNPTALVQQELEDLLLFTHQTLNDASIKDILLLLDSIRLNHSVYVDKQHKVFVKDAWWCQLLVLSSLRHRSRGLLEEATGNLLPRKALELFRPHRKESLHLLRLLAHLPDLHWDESVAADVLAAIPLMSLAPLSGFKPRAEELAKRALPFASPSQISSLLTGLPVRGIPTSELARYIQTMDFQKTISRILEMFENNIENREASALYSVVLSRLKEGFKAWADLVWPQFFAKLQAMSCEGEFYQSLLKYWIPQTVAKYQLQFSRFVLSAPLQDTLKAHVLLEAKRKFLLPSYSKPDLLFLNRIFAHQDTRSLAFQIVCSHFKAAALPTAAELHFIGQHLDATCAILGPKEVGALRVILGHIANVLRSKKVLENDKDALNRFLLQTFFWARAELRGGRKELAAQVLAPLWNVLVTSEPTTNASKLSEQVDSEDFKSLLEKSLLVPDGSAEALSRLAASVVETPTIISSDVMFHLIDERSGALSIQATNSVKNVACFIASVNSKGTSNGNSLLQADLETRLMKLFNGEGQSVHEMFKAALLLEALNQLPICDGNAAFPEWLATVFFPAVAAQMQEERLSWEVKCEKAMEALYDNLCQYFLKNLQIWVVVDYAKLVEALAGVIENSSLRRSTTVSASLLKHAFLMGDRRSQMKFLSDPLAGRDQQEQWESFKTVFLHKTLLKLERASPVQNLTIRRNPESRLILHAICLSDSSRQKVRLYRAASMFPLLDLFQALLNTTLVRLLYLLDHKEAGDSAVAAAMHCMELLISDNQIYADTLSYAPAVILQCVAHFENRNWVVRNACMQLEKALIDRFLGVVTGPNSRSRSVIELFQLFPQLAMEFFKVLTRSPLTDSALAVLQFFCESQVKPQPLPIVIQASFQQLFQMLIKQRCDVYGVFAAKAFVSLCCIQHIPRIVQDIVEVLLGDLSRIRRRHVLRNFLVLLEELLDKYTLSGAKSGQHLQMWKSLRELRVFLEKLNLPQLFDCLLVKVQSFDSALGILQKNCLDFKDYKQRMWLNSYLPFLVLNSSNEALSRVVQRVLSQNPPEFLQEKLLSVLLHRVLNSSISQAKTSEIFNCLILHAVKLAGSTTHLLACYFRVLLTLSRSCNSTDDEVLQIMRQDYGREILQNPYKTFIFHLALLGVVKSEADEKFCEQASLVRVPDDDDLIEDASRMLIHLHRNSKTEFNVKGTLRMALRFLVLHERWHFVTAASRKRIPTALSALRVILDYDFLMGVFQSDQLAFEFVKETFIALQGDAQRKEAIGGGKTFYEKEVNGFVTQGSLSRAVFKFLRDFCKNRPDSDELG
uniref:DUF2428 domain-containing protein n=1 Tax=Dendroctonus ponderosae TaxID=77166 RepID=A0AAR5Q4N3_DENPD